MRSDQGRQQGTVWFMQGDGEPGDIVATRLWRVPFFMPIMSAFLLAMVAEAMAGSYMALLAVQKIGMSPLELSAFLTVPAVMGIAITTIFGHLQDRKPVIWPMLISLFAKVFGLVACASITQTWLLIAVAGVLFGLSAASFALLFAVAKAYLDQLGGTIVSRGMAALRLVASLSWTIGPALGAALVWARGFAGVYLGAAFLRYSTSHSGVRANEGRTVSSAKPSTLLDKCAAISRPSAYGARSVPYRNVHGVKRHVDSGSARSRHTG
jgi:MFS family permease